MTGDELIDVAGSDPQVVQAYLHSAEFHAALDLFARVLPSFLRGLADEALLTQQRLEEYTRALERQERTYGMGPGSA